MIDEFVAKIDDRFGDWLSVDEVKFAWMMTFGYKIKKREIVEKFGDGKVGKTELVREIKRVAKGFDQGII